jgi:D-3-phosphoglycerate dehydrogenase
VGTIAKLGFTNHEDFTSSKEQIEAKIQDYQGIVTEADSRQGIPRQSH